MQEKYNEYPNYSKSVTLKIIRLLNIIRWLPLQGTGLLTNNIVRFLPKPIPKGPCIVNTLHGFKMIVDPILDKGIERDIFHYGTYEYGTLTIMKEILKKGDTFIDIGANIGLMTLHAAKITGKSGKVLSFEPLSSTYNILNKNIILNNFQNIKAINIAIGSTNGIVDIFENIAVCRGAASLIKSNNTKYHHKVDIKRIDNYLKEQNIKNINCIKVDVEGWEIEVLKGATNILSDHSAPICIIECSSLFERDKEHTRNIHSYLCNINSYKLFRLTRGKEKPSKLHEIKSVEELPVHDNLFCFLPQHIKELPSQLFYS